jgi:hypothetical protein
MRYSIDFLCRKKVCALTLTTNHSYYSVSGGSFQIKLLKTAIFPQPVPNKKTAARKAAAKESFPRQLCAGLFDDILNCVNKRRFLLPADMPGGKPGGISACASRFSRRRIYRI